MNVSAPAVINQSLSTITPVTPEAPAAPETPAVLVTPPAAPGPDKNLELARKFESVAQREGKARARDREVQTRATELEAREAKLKEREAELDDALGDPVGYMLKNGKDPVEVAKRYAQPETPEEKRIRRLEEAAEARDKADNDRKTEAEKAQQERAKFDALRGFVGEITAAECPNLTTLYAASEVPKLVEEALSRPSDPDDPESPTMVQAFFAEYNRNPTNEEIREFLEHEAELRATKILTAAEERRKAAEAASQSPSGAHAQDSSKNESGPSGISNQHAAVTASGKQRPLSLEERRKANRQALTAALEAEAGDD